MFVFIFVLFYSFYLIQLYANKKRVRKNGLLIGFSSISDVCSALSKLLYHRTLIFKNTYIQEYLYSKILFCLLLSIFYKIYHLFRLIIRRVFCRKAFCPLPRLPPSCSDKTLPPEACFRQSLFPIRKCWRNLAEYYLHGLRCKR